MAERITARDVEKLRREWLDAKKDAHELLASFARNADALTFDQSGVDHAVGVRAGIEVTAHKADLIRVAYEDARAELDAQQADDQVRATNRLAYVAVGATVIQALAAVAEYLK